MIQSYPLLRSCSFFRSARCGALRRNSSISSMSSSSQVATSTLSTRAIESSASGARQQYVRGVLPRSTVKRKVVLYIGYNGAKYHGFQRNEGVETISDVLESALHRAGAISDENLGSLSKISWVVSARTDKGVSAAGNALSLKCAFPRSSVEMNQNALCLDFATFVRNVNAALPPEIRVFGASKPTASFSAKDACAGRHYEYLLPLDALSGDRSLEAFATTLNQFQGSHYFHNFTTGKEHKIPPPPQAARYVTSCTCDPSPMTLEWTGDQFVRIRISGQSFMLHQIRKMVALSLLVQRKMVPNDALLLAMDRGTLVNVPPAPAVGLFLDGVFFDAYNKRYEEALSGPIELESYRQIREAFKLDQILPSIALLYREEDSMEIFFETIENHLPRFPASLSSSSPLIQAVEE